MSKLTKILLAIAATIAMFIGATTIGHASALPFSVNPILPKNQVNSLHTYFDLKVKPGSTQTLKVVLVNETKKAVQVKPIINAAKTNVNGVVDYTAPSLKLDGSAPADMANILKTTRSVKIPAKSKTTVTFKLQVPQKKFKGVLAGGITFKPVEGKQTNAAKGMSIINRYAYVVGIVLRESNQPVKPVMKLTKVQPAQINYRNVISSALVNKTATYLNQVKVITKVTKQGNQKVLYSAKKAGMQIAPNSQFNFPTQLNGKDLVAGKYRMDLKLISGLSTWHFKRDFTINGAKARALNRKDVTIKHNYTWWFIVAGVVLLLLVIFFIYLRMKKKEKELRAIIAEQGDK
ncbi:DUF916 and DUF3324 domain-containing protein [Periweissella cryptocerci]|nr:DUF916 and DUF3324 domain-containing protein [Periweissella cryptocerci]